LIMNAVNWLAAEEDLISVRPKPPENQHLTLNQRQMQRILYLGVIGIPLLIIVLGISVWWGRR
jgi:ABC-2 type transport system permease protein